MAQRVNVNLNNLLSVKLLELRRHLQKCSQCSGALKVHEYDVLCIFTRVAIVYVASRWDANISMRLRAKRSDSPFIYPCPNPQAHGGAYALTAEPVYISYEQPSLF